MPHNRTIYFIPFVVYQHRYSTDCRILTGRLSFHVACANQSNEIFILTAVHGLFWPPVMVGRSGQRRLGILPLISAHHHFSGSGSKGINATGINVQKQRETLGLLLCAYFSSSCLGLVNKPFMSDETT